MEHYGIIGHPVSHSISPLLHNRAFAILGMKARYTGYDIPPDQLSAAVPRLIHDGIKGFNVTLPHKQAITHYLHAMDEAAQQIGAVNTVVNRAGTLSGTNTDAYGAFMSLAPFADHIKNANVLLIGAGGSARAVLFSLLKKFSPSMVSIVSRTAEKGEGLSRHFQPMAPEIRIDSFQTSKATLERLVAAAGLIINSSPVGMAPHTNASPLPAEIPLRPDHIVFDLIYAPLRTTLLRNAEEAGATVIGGIEMLLHQGARAFEIWTGKPMPVDQIRPLILETLRSRTY